MQKILQVSTTKLSSYVPSQLKWLFRWLVLLTWLIPLVSLPIFAVSTFLLMIHAPDALKEIQETIGWLLPLDDGNAPLIDKLNGVFEPNAIYWDIVAAGFIFFALWHAWLSFRSLHEPPVGRYSTEISGALRKVIMSAFLPIAILMGVYLIALGNGLIKDPAIAFWYPVMLAVWVALRFTQSILLARVFPGHSLKNRLRKCDDDLVTIKKAIESTHQWRITPNSVPVPTNGSEDWSPSHRMVRLERREAALRARIEASTKEHASHSLPENQSAMNVDLLEKSVHEFLLDVSNFVENIKSEIRDANTVLSSVTGQYLASPETEISFAGNSSASSNNIHVGRS
jgi:hypothetical protein